MILSALQKTNIPIILQDMGDFVTHIDEGPDGILFIYNHYQGVYLHPDGEIEWGFDRKVKKEK